MGKGTIARRNVATAAALQVVALATSLVRIPLVLHALGPAAFGLWSAIIAAAGLSTLADFGLQHAVLQQVAQLRGENRMAEIRTVVSTAFWLSMLAFGLMSAGTLLWLAIASPFGHQATEASVSSSEAHLLLLLAFVASFAAQPAKLLHTAQQGFERIYWLNIASIISSTLQFGGFSVLVTASHSFLALGLWAIAWDLLAAVVVAVILSRRNPDHISVARRDWRRHVVRPLANQAGAFFFMILANSLRWSLDSLVILSVLGPLSVTRYQPTIRLFITGLTVAPLVFGSLWPSFAESAARGDMEWIRRAFHGAAICVMGIAVVVAVTVTSFGKDALLRWVGEPGFSGYSVLLVLTVWFLLMMWTQIAAQMIVSFGGARSVMKWALAEGVANTALSIALAHYIGLFGVALASLLAVAVFGIVPLTWRLRVLCMGQVGLPVAQLVRLLGVGSIVAVGPTWWGIHRSQALGVPALVLASAGLAVVVGSAIWWLAFTTADRQGVRGQVVAALRFR